jgi:hypothetical protein
METFGYRRRSRRWRWMDEGVADDGLIILELE